MEIFYQLAATFSQAIAGGLILGVYLTFRLISSLIRKLGLKKLYKQAQGDLKLEFKKGGFRHPPRLEGKIDDFQLRIEHPYWRPAKNSYIIDVQPGSKNVFFFKFILRPRKDMDIMDKAYRNALQSLDKKFDTMIDIEGHDEVHTLAMFTPEARSLIIDLTGISSNHKFLIKRNCISVTVASEDLESIAAKVLKLAAILKRPGSEADHLKENFYNPCEQVQIRRRNLILFIQNFPEHPQLPAVINQALADEDAEICFMGFQRAGKQADLGYLKKIWEKAPNELKTKVCRYLSHSEVYIPFLIDVYPQTSMEHKLIILGSLKQIASTRVNDFLIKELKNPDMILKRAVIQALGTCGTISAVEPLYYLKNITLRSEAKTAITQIQARLGPAENGWLSISGDAGGNLSLAPPTGEGALSLEAEK